MKFNLVHDLLSGLAWHEHLFGIFFGVLVFFFCVGICMRLHQCFGFLFVYLSNFRVPSTPHRVDQSHDKGSPRLIDPIKMHYYC